MYGPEDIPLPYISQQLSYPVDHPVLSNNTPICRDHLLT